MFFDLFEAFHEHVLVAENGRLVYSNSPAKSLLTVIGTDECLSTLFGSCLNLQPNQKISNPSLEIGSAIFHMSAMRADDYIVFILNPIPQNPDKLLPVPFLSFAGNKLRDNISDLFASSQALFRRVEELDDESLNENIERMNRSMFRLVRVSGNMSDIGDLADGNMRLNTENVDITKMLGDIVKHLSGICELIGVKLQYTSPKEQIVTAADKFKLEKAIYNLVSNSLGSLPDGGLIKLNLSQNGNRIIINISDNGSGIPSDELQTLFVPFTIKNQSNPSGLGLGLPIVREIIALHGGSIILESSNGTTVIISLPNRRVQSNELNSTIANYDFSGGFDNAFVELSDVLPKEIFSPLNID